MSTDRKPTLATRMTRQQLIDNLEAFAQTGAVVMDYRVASHLIKCIAPRIMEIMDGEIRVALRNAIRRE
jgi:hypothetical protein